MPKAIPLKDFNCSNVALAMEGIAPAASRLMGYQMLPSTNWPYRQASTAMAAPRASPPLMPDEYG